MNKKILALSLVAAFAMPAMAMAANSTPHWFVNGQIGQSKLRGMTASNDTSTGTDFNVGYRWDVGPTIQLGVEAGYADLGKYSDSSYNTNVQGKLSGNTIGITSRFLFGSHWYMNLDGGYFAAKQQIDGNGLLFTGYNTYAYNYHSSHTKGSSYVTLGFGYDFNRNVSLGVNVSNFDDKDSQFDLTSGLYGVSPEVRF